MSNNTLAPKLLAELIGTFALVFIGAGAASIVGGSAGGGITAVAFAHGLTLMVFICAYGSVSGGHMNPAVTVGVLAVGAITAAEAAGYIVSQIAAGLGTPELAHGLVLAGAPVTITPAIGFTRPCANSGVPRPVATPPSTIR